MKGAIAAPRASQQNSETTTAEAAFRRSPEGRELRDVYGHRFVAVDADPPEIGAATGIEFLAGGRLLAAAEPERRGGGTAMAAAP